MKRIYVLLSLIVIFAFTACEDFFNPFTNSLGKNEARDLTEQYSKLSTGELISALNDSAIKGDANAQSALLDSLNKKDSKDFENISNSDKEKLLDLVFDVGVPIKVLSPILQEASGGSLENIDIDAILDAIKKESPTIGTKLPVELLKDKNLLENGDTSTIMLGALTVASQIIKSEDLDTKEVTDCINKIFSDDAGTVDEALAGLEVEGDSKESLKVVLETFEYLKGAGKVKDISDLAGLFGFK